MYDFIVFTTLRLMLSDVLQGKQGDLRRCSIFCHPFGPVCDSKIPKDPRFVFRASPGLPSLSSKPQTYFWIECHPHLFLIHGPVRGGVWLLLPPLQSRQSSCTIRSTSQTIPLLKRNHHCLIFHANRPSNIPDAHAP